MWESSGRPAQGYHPSSVAELERYVRWLQRPDWNEPEFPMKLRADLPVAELTDIRLLNQTRLFLRLMAEAGSAPLTPGGYLKRAYVARMIEQMEWPREHMAKFPPGMFKKVDEFDAKPLDTIRRLCECAGWVRHRRNALYVPRRVLGLLDDDKASWLYRELFITFFRRFSIWHVFSDDAAPAVQHTAAVTLWRLSVVAGNWMRLPDLPQEVLLDGVREVIARRTDLPGWELVVLNHLMLTPLSWFGLLDCDRPADALGHEENTRFRKTALFDRFITFCPPPPFIQAS
jgi:hypothetical protein